MSEMIGRLRVALGLETAAFERGAKRAAAEIDTFGSKAEKAGFKIGSMAKTVAVGGAALAGTAIVGQIKDMVTAGLEYASALGEQAQQLGVTTKAMQEYRHVASQTGVSNEEMDAALAKLSRTTGDAANGSKKAQGAFDALGISIRDANGKVKDAGDLIPEIAGALEKIPSPAERASRLVDLFGKSGQKLAPLMAEGAGGVQKLRDEAHQLGLVLSDEQIQKADATADKIAKLNNQFNTRIAGVVADNAGAIEKLVDQLGKLLEKILKLIEYSGKFENSTVGKLIGYGATITNPLSAGLKGFDIIEGAVTASNKSKGGAAPVAPKASVSPAWGKTTTAPLLQSGSTYTGLRTNFAGGSSLMPSASSTFAGMQPGRPSAFFPWIIDESDAMQHAADLLSQKVEDTTDTVEKSTDDIEAANERVKQSFADMANNSLNALQSLVNAVQSGDIVGILQTVLGLGQALGINFGGGGMGSAGDINSSALDSLRGSVLAMPAYAGGTNFHPGGLAMVGERGPEIVRLPRGSAVYPHGTGPGGGMAVQVLPSKYFDVRVYENIGTAAPSLIEAGGERGYGKVVKKGRRSLVR